MRFEFEIPHNINVYADRTQLKQHAQTITPAGYALDHFEYKHFIFYRNGRKWAGCWLRQINEQTQWKTSPDLKPPN